MSALGSLTDTWGLREMGADRPWNGALDRWWLLRRPAMLAL